MRTRSALLFGLSAALLSTPAYAQQRGNVGQQIQRQILNNLAPTSPYQNPGYGAYPQQGYGQARYQPPWRGYSQPNQFGYQQPWQGIAPQQTAQRYQLPTQFNGFAPGQSINYGGATYIVNRDGTMSPAAPAAPVAAPQRYQIPAEYAGASPGSTISYGGANYAINTDGTMSPLTGVR